jgi:hypothetical protein
MMLVDVASEVILIYPSKYKSQSPLTKSNCNYKLYCPYKKSLVCIKTTKIRIIAPNTGVGDQKEYR